MSLFPHSQLLFSPSHTVAISGPYIQILDPSTGAVLATTVDRPGAETDKAGPIRVAALDSTGTHLATSADDKQLRLWRLDGLALLNERELPKKPTALAFTRDGQTILASDKFGDVFSYALHPAPQTAAQKNAALASHENPSGGALILGHASFLTAFLLTPDEKYIVTADRDEHIRVSWFPQGYTIETYCLGHEKFVSALHLPTFAPEALVSGGGDPVLKVWDWLRGTLSREIPVLDAVAPFIKVKPARRTPRRFEDDGGYADEGAKKKKSRKEKARAKHKRKGGSAGAEEAEPAEADAAGSVEGEAAASVEGEAAGSLEADAEAAQSLDAAATDLPEHVFALQRLESLQPDSSETGYLIFSAVGATALFSCPYSSSEPAIDVFDFGKPVLDFSIAQDGLIWVCLDGQWGETASTTESAPRMVRVVRLVEGKLAELESDGPTPLLAALNSTCLLPATAPALRTLELYLALSALPKNNESEHDPMDREREEQGSSRKEQGRLKSKTAVAKVRSTRPADDAEEEREAKRVRSEQQEGDVV
ncbi:quinon protein alcohol dehydrogenase-like superfamily, partial [Mycena vulgaris]